MKLLNCTTCAAPLDVESVRAMTVRCDYCGNTIIIPYALRESGDGELIRDAGGFVGPAVDQALRLAEFVRLVKAGKEIEAIKLYRTIFPVGLKEAKDAVEQIEAGRPITYAHSVSHAEHVLPQNVGSIRIMRGQQSGHMPRQTVLWLVLGVVLVCVAGAAVAAIAGFASFFSSPSASSQEPPGRATAATPRPIVPPVTLPGAVSSTPSTPAFADVALEFGSEGIGAGQFKDARSVAVDGEGRIYVGEYTGGRIQVFDSNGTFLTQWMADTKPVLLSLAADRKGTVYVVHPGSIFRYEGATGKLLGEVPKLLTNGRYEYYRDVFVALDGSLFAIGSDYTIIRISPEGAARIVVNVKEKTGENLSIERVAVDGQGNIYALEWKDNFVLKFSSDGRFITRFGGRGNQPGQLLAPHNLAVDGQGRVYVSDSGRAVEVFDSNGRYIATFGGRELVFGMAINDRDEIFTAQRNRHKIVRFTIRK